MKPSLMHRLRSVTRPAHDRIAELPFVRALNGGTLPRETFIGFLQAMHVVHSGLERELGRACDPRLAGVWNDTMARSRDLRADLKQLADSNVRTTPKTPAATELVRQLRRRARAIPISLLGDLYVFEGSRRGAPTLAMWAQRHEFGITSRYLSGAVENAPRAWRNFGVRLNAVALSEREVSEVILGAEAAFAAMERVVASLSPEAAARAVVDASQLNPQAGYHPVTQDPVELESARRAGLLSLQEFPYLMERYGERGRRFTASDSAWLVTLAALPQRAALEEVRWLANVLAARGMPSVILERHLQRLQSELEAAVARDFQVLGGIARQLEEERLALISQRATLRICEQFNGSVEPQLLARVGNVAGLLVCAVADEAAGRARAVSSLCVWLRDAERFPPGWVTSVDTALAGARSALRRRPPSRVLVGDA